MTVPRVSDLIPAWNSMRFLPAAVASLRAQRRVDLDIVIIDDGSDDGTWEWISRQDDLRIRGVRNETNRGVAASLNRGLAMARGEWVARMDADDISRPDRIWRQVEFLETHPRVGLCGTWVRVFGAGRAFTFRYPTGPDTVRAAMLFANPLAHGSVVFRRDLFESQGLRYDERLTAAQDFELWRRCAPRFEMDNLPRVLLDYRVHDRGVTVMRGADSRAHLLRELRDELRRLEISPSEKELLFHAEVGHGSGMRSRVELQQARAWLERLLAQNERVHAYTLRGLRRAAGRVWFQVCRNSAHLGVSALRAYRRETVRGDYRPDVSERVDFLAAVWMAACFPRRRQAQGRLGVMP